MKELLEKLTKRTEETNAALQVNTALTKEGNASLRIQSQLAKAQDEKLRSLVNITKAGLLGDEIQYRNSNADTSDANAKLVTRPFLFRPAQYDLPSTATA